MEKDTVRKILKKEQLMSLGTKGDMYPDNSIVCFAYDNELNLYFGSYDDTLKCKNIAYCNIVAITIGTLQIHGKANIVPYNTLKYNEERKIYDERFPQYKSLFEQEKNELYKIEPMVIWDYRPSKGEMYRDVLIFNEEYYKSIDVYKPHAYEKRK